MTPARSPWKAIIFDFDGTLAALSIDFVAMRAALLELMSAYRIPITGIGQLHALEMIEAAGLLLAGRRRKERARFLFDARALVTQIEMKAADRGTLFDGTKKLLTELRHRAIKTGVITRNCRTAIFRMFPDINCFCHVVLTRDDTVRVKPHPDHLKAALGALGVVPAEAAMVGDHPMDIQTGRKTGTFTIGVLTGNGSRGDLHAAQADVIISEAAEILALLPNRNQFNPT